MLKHHVTMNGMSMIPHINAPSATKAYLNMLTHTATQHKPACGDQRPRGTMSYITNWFEGGFWELGRANL